MLQSNKRGEDPETLSRVVKTEIICKCSRLLGMKELVTLSSTQLRIKLSKIMVGRTFSAILDNLTQAQSMHNAMMIMTDKSLHINRTL